MVKIYLGIILITILIIIIYIIYFLHKNRCNDINKCIDSDNKCISMSFDFYKNKSNKKCKNKETTFNLTLPNTTLPNTTLPNIRLLNTTLPNIRLPNTTLPNIRLPSTTLPNIQNINFLITDEQYNNLLEKYLIEKRINDENINYMETFDTRLKIIVNNIISQLFIYKKNYKYDDLKDILSLELLYLSNKNLEEDTNEILFVIILLYIFLKNEENLYEIKKNAIKFCIQSLIIHYDFYFENLTDRINKNINITDDDLPINSSIIKSMLHNYMTLRYLNNMQDIIEFLNDLNEIAVSILVDDSSFMKYNNLDVSGKLLDIKKDFLNKLNNIKPIFENMKSKT